ncbi:MAG: hypothetical protein AB3X44_13550 [Leptothrix sp. (in: b-proteobacteria)]
MNLLKNTAAILTLYSFGAVAGDIITIDPLDKQTPKILGHAKKVEKISLAGTLPTIPMSGAKTTI